MKILINNIKILSKYIVNKFYKIDDDINFIKFEYKLINDGYPLIFVIFIKIISFITIPIIKTKGRV